MLRYWLIMPQPPQRQQARRVDVGATCGGGGAVRGLVAILLGLSIWSKMANSQASAVVFGAFMRAGIWGSCGWPPCCAPRSGAQGGRSGCEGSLTGDGVEASEEHARVLVGDLDDLRDGGGGAAR